MPNSVGASTSNFKARRRALFFPEGRLGLEVVHQELTGLEALASVGRAHRHQNDLIRRLQQADAVHHASRQDLEAPPGLGHHGLDGLLGHARVVFQLQAGDRSRIAWMPVANRADEAADRSDPPVAAPQPRQFMGHIEIGRLDGHHTLRHGPPQPPVTGGKKAISSPSASVSDSSHIS